MHIIGLCGGSGSGKGTVCRLFSELGIPSIDADAVYHRITSSYTPCLAELEEAFGGEVVVNGALDRGALRNIVFSSDNKNNSLKLLNSITLKYVVAEMLEEAKRLELLGHPFVIFDAPLLFESNADKYCSAVISVVADKNLRIERLVSRDGLSYEQVERRIASQLSDEWLIEKSDFVIENNGNFNELKLVVNEIFKKLNDRFGEQNG